MDYDFYVLVSESENQYGHETTVGEIAYAVKKQAQRELSAAYEAFVKECDKGAVGDFAEYDIVLTDMKDFRKWRITSATYPQFYEEMRLEKVTVTMFGLTNKK